MASDYGGNYAIQLGQFNVAPDDTTDSGPNSRQAAGLARVSQRSVAEQ